MTKSGKPSPRRVIGLDRDTWRQDEAQEHATAPQDAAKARAVGEPPHFPTRRSLRGLDWFVFFVADVQTGFGPFVAVYLTEQKWTQVDIGLVLTVGALASLAGQMPGGALVDAARSERLVAGIAVAAIAISALAYAASPVFAVILAATVLHSAASCVLGPAMAAISLGLVGHGAIGERLGRNARFAAIGNGLAAVVMGATGYFLSARAVFFVTAALLGPALLALRWISSREIDPKRAHGGPPEPRARTLPADLLKLLRKRPLIIFAGCVMLFHLANAAMLPLMGGVLTTRSSDWATILIAACIVGPQLLVAIFSPAPRYGDAGRCSWRLLPHCRCAGSCSQPCRILTCWSQLNCSTAFPPRCSPSWCRSSSPMSRGAPGISISARESSAPPSELALR